MPFQKEIITLLKGVQIRQRGSIFASGYGPGGPNPRGFRIRCDTVTAGLETEIEMIKRNSEGKQCYCPADYIDVVIISSEGTKVSAAKIKIVTIVMVGTLFPLFQARLDSLH